VKWVFLLALLIGTPVLAGLLRSKPRYLVPTCFVLGVSMFLVAPDLWSALIPWPVWPGPVKGMEVSFVDAISLTLIASTRSVRIPLSIKLSFLIYCFAIVVSTFAAFQPEPAMFYAWQLFRSVLLLVAIARVCRTEPKAAIALVSGLGLGLICEGVIVGWQYVHGNPRPGGTLGHSNIMGLALEFGAYPMLALLLTGRRLLFPGAALLCALVISVLGGSRATMGLFALGVLLTLVLSIRRKGSSRKYAFAGALTLLLLVSAPVMIWAVNKRSDEALESSDAERTAMKAAARMIIADHPLGVGANQYVVIANTEGYSARAGVVWNEDSRLAPVHDTYYLITAEMGFLGLAGILAILASFIILGFRLLRCQLPDEMAELVPGLIGTMIMVTIHINFEFAFMEFVLHYLFAIAGGILVGIAARTRMSAQSAAAVPAMRAPDALMQAG
jgi:hypothetical protein